MAVELATIATDEGRALQSGDELKALNQDNPHAKDSSAASSSPLVTASTSAAQEKYYNYLRALRSAWSDMPQVNISYSRLSYRMDIPVSDTEVPSLLKAVRGVGRMFTWKTRPTYQLQALSNVSGVVRPKEMTLILAPPGHGKSVLLKALSSRLRSATHLSGSVLYNGLTASELERQTNLRAKKLTAYVGQQDLHMSLLTVRETFHAALAHSVADISLLKDEEVQRQHADKVEVLLDVLGLRECADTIVGNDIVRGCSGGQKKRVTIGEQLIGNARVLFLDEITTGLDAAVAFDILNVLNNWCKIMSGSVVAALLQPTPEIYSLFSQVILLREGECVYGGPRAEVGQYLHNLGIKCPSDQDEADFIVDFLTDPSLYRVKFQQRELRRLHHQQNINSAIVSKRSSNPHLQRQYSGSESENIVTFHVGSAVHYAKNLDGTTMTIEEENTRKAAEEVLMRSEKLLDDKKANRAPENMPLSTSALVEAFQKSSYYSNLSQELIELSSKEAIDGALLQSVKKSAFTQRQFASDFCHSQFQHLAINLRRQGRYMSRNKLMIIPRIIVGIFMGFCIGTLYFNLAADNYISRLGLILFCCVHLAFSNLSELPTSEELKKAVGKHLDASWYSAWVQIVATILFTMPVAFLEALVFSLLVYFVAHFDYDPGRYFFALLMLYFSNLVLGSLFRLVSYIVKSAEVAHEIGGPIIAMFMGFGGVLIQEKNIPDYLIEFFWFSPFSWTVRSLALNEFNDGRYSTMVTDPNNPSQLIRQGDSYLELYQIRTDNAWKWAGFGYLLGLFIFFGVLTTLALKYLRSDESIGTKRPPEEEAIRSKMSLEAVEVAIQEELALQSKVHDASPTSRHLASKKQANSSTVLPFVQTTMTWRDLVYSIAVDGKDRVLLNGVSGYARPGVLTALMGASGAGKTTLIDVLAGRKTQGTLQGSILVNGIPFRDVNFRRVLGYVEQNDLHFPLTTVREALLFSANLRLPAEVSDKQREAFVEELIELLELKPICDRVVGSENVAGLAGWQRKLVTIGVELASNPAILCLDEPTSGLDSRAALVVMRVIRKIASTGRSVICTIHQPSQEVFLMFDRLLLLKSGGETVYFGPLGGGDADSLVEYFETATPETPIAPMPEKMNPASWMLEVIGAGTVKNDTDYARIFKQHALHDRLEHDFKDIETDLQRYEQHQQQQKQEKTTSNRSDSSAEYSSSFFRQLYHVLSRAFSGYWRNVPFNGHRFLSNVLIGLLFGLVYRDTRDIGTSFASLQSRFAAIFMNVGFSSALQTIIVLPVLITDRAAFYRERSSRTYSSSVYSLATFLVDVPYVFFGGLCFAIPFYFLIALPNDGEFFFRYIFAIFLNQVNFSSAGHLLAAIAPNVAVGSQMMGVVLTFWIFFAGGTFIPPASIPNGWIWMYWIDSLPKSMMACLGEIFNCDGPPGNGEGECPYILAPQGANGVLVPVTYTDFFEQSYNTAAGEYGKWIGYLILTIVVMRILVATAISKVSHLKR